MVVVRNQKAWEHEMSMRASKSIGYRPYIHTATITICAAARRDGSREAVSSNVLLYSNSISNVSASQLTNQLVSCESMMQWPLGVLDGESDTAQDHQDIAREEKSKLKTMPGSISAESVLPPELLSAIFLLIVQAHVGASPARWMAISQVCRYWRKVALSCAEIWSDIDLGHLPFVEMMLQRSGEHPLSVRFESDRESDGPEMVSAIRRVLQQGHRLRSLEFTIDASSTIKVESILGECLQSAPLLEHARMEAEVDFMTQHIATLPKTFLAGGTPRLRSLIVNGLRVPGWKALPLCAGLTDLELYFYWSLQQERPGEREFYASLEMMSNLETLALWGCLSTESPGQTQSTLVFPKLLKLELNDTTVAIENFLRTIRLPREASLDLLYQEVDDEPLTPIVLSALKVAWPGMAQCPEVMDIPGRTGWPQVTLSNFDVHMGTLTVGIQRTFDDDRFSRLLVSLSKNIDFSHLKTWTVRIGHTFNSRTWGLIDLVAKITNLKFNICSPRTFVDFLNSPNLPDDPASEEYGRPVSLTPPPFPNLSVITLRQLDPVPSISDIRPMVEGMRKLVMNSASGVELRLVDCTFRTSGLKDHWTRKMNSIPGLCVVESVDGQR